MSADKYQNKYRIPSIRMQKWDYTWNAAYFITISTDKQKHYFGKIKNGKMELSPVGIIADVLWHEIPFHSKNVELGAFIVMPNHIHGIIIINNPTHTTDNNIQTGHADNIQTGHTNNIQTGNADNVQTGNADNVQTGNADNVQTGHALSLQGDTQSKPNQKPAPIGKNRYQNIGKNSLSSIIGGYKSAVTKHANRLEFTFKWQTRFYEHIIRDEKSFENITRYIINNPTKWERDKFFK